MIRTPKIYDRIYVQRVEGEYELSAHRSGREVRREPVSVATLPEAIEQAITQLDATISPSQFFMDYSNGPQCAIYVRSL